MHYLLYPQEMLACINMTLGGSTEAQSSDSKMHPFGIWRNSYKHANTTTSKVQDIPIIPKFYFCFYSSEKEKNKKGINLAGLGKQG